MRGALIISSVLFGVALALPTSWPDPDRKHLNPRQAASLGHDRPTEEQLDGFLSQFMSVQDGPEQSNAIPEVAEDTEGAEKEDVEEPSSKSYGWRRKKSRKSSKSRHSDRDYDDDHKEEAFFKASTDCRFRIEPKAKDLDDCVELVVDSELSCFWDFKLAKLHKPACKCPRTTKKQCSEDKLTKKQCFWHTSKPAEKDSYGKKKKKEKTEDEHGVCMHNSERFYNVLSRLLAKRGKKDLSLQIHYSSAPARGKLPYGPHGPAIIGYGDEFEKAYDRYEEEARDYDRRPYDSHQLSPYGFHGGFGGGAFPGYGFDRFGFGRRRGYGYDDDHYGYDDHDGYGYDDHDGGYDDDDHDGGYDDDYGYEPDYYPPFYPPILPYAGHFGSQLPSPFAGLFGQPEILSQTPPQEHSGYPSPYPATPYGLHPMMPYGPMMAHGQPQCNCNKQDQSGYPPASYGPQPAVPAYPEPAAPAYPEPDAPSTAYPEPTPPTAVYPEPAPVYPEPVVEPAEYNAQYQVPYAPPSPAQGPPQAPSYSPPGQGYAQSYSQPLSSQPSYNPFLGPPTHSLPYYG